MKYIVKTSLAVVAAIALAAGTLVNVLTSEASAQTNSTGQMPVRWDPKLEVRKWL